MPELPEVQTIVDGLNRQATGATIVSVFSDWKKMIQKPKTWKNFEKMIVGKEIKNIERKGKNIIFYLSENVALAAHLRMTGHFLMITPEKRRNKNDPIHEKVNQYVHFQMELADGRTLALSDPRKFAKIFAVKESEIDKLILTGRDPLDDKFTLKNFRETLKNKHGNIKQILMDQTLIAGIGNIYSSEILWEAKANPSRKTETLGEKEKNRIFHAMKKILKLAVEARGDSESDYRDVDGNKGGYQKIHKVYQREGEKCLRKDGGIIKRIKIGQRSAFYCPVCQK